jgi:ribosomal protein S11
MIQANFSSLPQVSLFEYKKESNQIKSNICLLHQSQGNTIVQYIDKKRHLDAKGFRRSKACKDPEPL